MRSTASSSRPRATALSVDVDDMPFAMFMEVLGIASHVSQHYGRGDLASVR